MLPRVPPLACLERAGLLDLILYAYCKPFSNGQDDFLATVAQIEVELVLLYALLLKMDVTSTDNYNPGLMGRIMSGILHGLARAAARARGVAPRERGAQEDPPRAADVLGLLCRRHGGVRVVQESGGAADERGADVRGALQGAALSIVT